MSFDDDLRAFQAKTERRLSRLLTNCAAEVRRSVQEGSSLTGAPGQPVDTGNLRSSWTLTFPTRWTAMIATGVEYAPYIEDRVGGMNLRSEVGGFHSVKMTRAGWPNIVAAVARRVRE